MTNEIIHIVKIIKAMLVGVVALIILSVAIQTIAIGFGSDGSGYLAQIFGSQNVMAKPSPNGIEFAQFQPQPAKPQVPTRPSLYFGVSSPNVASLQRFLNSHGFKVAKTGPGSPGNETSYFGPGTRNATILFQKNFGLEVSGMADTKLLTLISEFYPSSKDNKDSKKTWMCPVGMTPIYDWDGNQAGCVKTEIGSDGGNDIRVCLEDGSCYIIRIRCPIGGECRIKIIPTGILPTVNCTVDSQGNVRCDFDINPRYWFRQCIGDDPRLCFCYRIEDPRITYPPNHVILNCIPIEPNPDPHRDPFPLIPGFPGYPKPVTPDCPSPYECPDHGQHPQ